MIIKNSPIRDKEFEMKLADPSMASSLGEYNVDILRNVSRICFEN